MLVYYVCEMLTYYLRYESFTQRVSVYHTHY